ncbi:host cell surface-exposed lipoprotein [Stenotrophomonas humi]|uniref:Host cell surface-exposed lipoprotein n=1 Tax=Stenotrophomonas humi TaxID=405444 RepID=A0A0R0C8E5_9GAMM|nr:Ltp family lipoprotein [Stenotrophomonas humi]KRG65568.1 host cell surface-exposed lipoprotein [Stenotrophomonas humi]
MKKFLKWILIAFVGLLALGMIIEATKSPEQKAADAAAREQKAAERAEAKKQEAARVEEKKEEAAPVEAKKEEAAAAAAAAAPSLTGPQKNAIRSAEQYLSMGGFSRNGLINQLSADAGEGFSVADATFAVDSLNADWNEQAAKSAAQYLSIQGFSCKGLIEQLSSSAGDKYTVSEATSGAHKAGACS